MTMRITPIIAATAAAGLVAAACAADGAPARTASAEVGQCFRGQDVRSFHAKSNDTVLLRVGVDRYYELGLPGGCGDIDWTQRIALQSRGSSFICSSADAVVIAPSTIGPQRCMATSLRRLSPVEVAALAPGEKP